jgi:hypothetical protein
MNVSEFVAKWRKVELTQRSASQQQFADLCNGEFECSIVSGLPNVKVP